MTGLADLALRYRILPEYEGIGGEIHQAPPATLRALLGAFGVACEDAEARAASARVSPSGPAPRLVAPSDARCHMPDWLEEGRAWGVALQLYQIRSSRNWGIGDFVDLADLPACGFGRVIRLKRSDVDDFIEGCRVVPGTRGSG